MRIYSLLLVKLSLMKKILQHYLINLKMNKIFIENINVLKNILKGFLILQFNEAI